MVARAEAPDDTAMGPAAMAATAGARRRFFRYVILKLFAGVITVLGVLTLTFMLVRLAPGDPAARILDVYGTPEAVAELRSQMGLDRPVHAQYFDYLGGIVTGDLGDSLQSRRSVASLIGEVLPHTIMLAVAATLVGLCIGVFLGIVAAVYRGSFYDYLASVVSVLGISLPLFWLGIVFLLLFSLHLGLFPATGTGEGPLSTLHHLALPAVVLGIQLAGLVARIVRSSMIEELSKGYIVTVRSIGGSSLRTVRHAMKNSLVSLVAVFGIQFSQVLGGLVVLEVVFARPGLGKLIVDAIVARDYPVALGGIVFFSIIIVIVMTLTEVLYGVVNPRIREGK